MQKWDVDVVVRSLSSFDPSSSSSVPVKVIIHLGKTASMVPEITVRLKIIISVVPQVLTLSRLDIIICYDLFVA